MISEMATERLPLEDVYGCKGVPGNNFSAIAKVICLHEGSQFSNYLKNHVASKIIPYFCLTRERKYNVDAKMSDRKKSPTFYQCKDLLTEGTPPSHILHEDPEPRHFKDMVDVWAWAMTRILYCINHARDDIECSDYEVMDEFPKLAATHDSGRSETYAVLYRFMLAINKQMDRNNTTKLGYRNWSLKRADMAWPVMECDQYEQSKLRFPKLPSYTDCQPEHDWSPKLWLLNSDDSMNKLRAAYRSAGLTSHEQRLASGTAIRASLHEVPLRKRRRNSEADDKCLPRPSRRARRNLAVLDLSDDEDDEGGQQQNQEQDIFESDDQSDADQSQVQTMDRGVGDDGGNDDDDLYAASPSHLSSATARQPSVVTSRSTPPQRVTTEVPHSTSLFDHDTRHPSSASRDRPADPGVQPMGGNFESIIGTRPLKSPHPDYC